MSSDKSKATIATAYTLLKATAAGALVGEAWFLGKAFRPQVAYLAERMALYDSELVIAAAGIALLVCFLLTQGYTLRSLRMMAQSRRADVLLAFFFGTILPFLVGGFGAQKYAVWAAALTPAQLGTLLLAPFGIIVAVLVRELQKRFETPSNSSTPFFISDDALNQCSEDLLNVADDAHRFAERVLNHGSNQNLVFGIDAPWGIGKSTFINFCKEHWRESDQNAPIVYEFNPLRYAGNANLSETFIDGLIRAIQQTTYVPELRSLASRYSRFVRGAKARIHFFDFELPSGTYNIDDAFEDLESALIQLRMKVIVVVDDLDRLTLTHVKEVLYTIRKSFALPNVTYVLAYDTENLGTLDDGKPDPDKLTEFLEKFINVKIGIYLDSNRLISFITGNLAATLSGNSQADPILVAQAIGGLTDIIQSSDFYKYQPLIGDIRKIKRLLNTLMLLEIERTDFKNSDFNKEDLIHLLLIYINFPNVFRRIYNSETQGRAGIFSLKGPYDQGYPEADPKERISDKAQFKNSADFMTYRNSLRESQQFLVDRVFTASIRLKHTEARKVSEEVKRSYACFNGGGGTGNNLEQYLNLIVRLAKPQNETQYRFYLNGKDDISNGIPIDEVFQRESFDWNNGEESREHLWRVIANSTSDFTSTIGMQLVGHLMDHLQDYCELEVGELHLGLRHTLPLYLLKLLDTVNWKDQPGMPFSRTGDYVAEIAKIILGEGDFADRGVIQTLTSIDRGVLGFFDFLMFRLYCCADRGGSIFNVQRALSLHGSPDAPTSGLTTTIAIEEMREISQLTFRIFDERYIQPKVNFYSVVDALSRDDLCGRASAFVTRKEADGALTDVEARLDALRSVIKSFVIYQLGSQTIEMGVPCGHYDETGKEDKHGISDRINDYLFGICFNPEAPAGGYRYFLDFLLRSLSSTFGYDGRNFVSTLNELTRVLQSAQLARYWSEHRAGTRAFASGLLETTVHTPNYVASYGEDLNGAFLILDQLVESSADEAANPESDPPEDAESLEADPSQADAGHTG